MTIEQDIINLESIIKQKSDLLASWSVQRCHWVKGQDARACTTIANITDIERMSKELEILNGELIVLKSKLNDFEESRIENIEDYSLLSAGFVTNGLPVKILIKKSTDKTNLRFYGTVTDTGFGIIANGWASINADIYIKNIHGVIVSHALNFDLSKSISGTGTIRKSFDLDIDLNKLLSNNKDELYIDMSINARVGANFSMTNDVKFEIIRENNIIIQDPMIEKLSSSIIPVNEEFITTSNNTEQEIIVPEIQTVTDPVKKKSFAIPLIVVGFLFL